MQAAMYGLAAVSGALFSLAYPPYPFGFLGCVGLIPLFYLCRNVPVHTAVARGMVWATALHATTIFWLFAHTVPGATLAFCYLALLSGVFPLILAMGQRVWGDRWLYTAPVFWIAIEHLRSIGVMGFPWLNLAHTQTYTPLWIQFADLVGAPGVSIWVAVCNGLGYWLLERYRRRISLRWVLLLCFFWAGWPGLYGLWRMQHLPPITGRVSVGIIQGNVDAGQRWLPEAKEANYQKYARLSHSIAASRPALLIWPESASHSYLRYAPVWRDKFYALADSLGTPIFTGAVDLNTDSTLFGRYFNASFLIRPGGAPLETYAKRQLVPFGEHNPLAATFPILLEVDFGPNEKPSNFAEGQYATVLEVPGFQMVDGGLRPARFAPLICFESIFPGLTRSYRDKAVDFLVIITNDGWFGELSAPYQHAQMAVFRAIETRRPIARCANTGVSLVIDIAGRIRQATPTYVERAFISYLESTDAMTVYARYGDVLPWLLIVFAGAGLILTFGFGVFHRGRAAGEPGAGAAG